MSFLQRKMISKIAIACFHHNNINNNKMSFTMEDSKESSIILCSITAQTKAYNQLNSLKYSMTPSL